ncbi:RHS repeat-associated core domain-containing protein, partial [Flavobacterium macacae]
MAMYFRHYDNANGRFNCMDRLADLMPGITPYRFAFNNPNSWSDPTGLFENQASAFAYMNQLGISG